MSSLEPKDVEEVKPGFFVQKTKKGYRQVNPLVWKGKFRSKQQLKTVFSFRTLVWVAVIGLLLLSYYSEIRPAQELFNEINENPIAWCNNILSTRVDPTLLGRFDLEYETAINTVSLP